MSSNYLHGVETLELKNSSSQSRNTAAALILNHKEKLSKEIELFAHGMGNKDIMIMCLVFILASAFTASTKAVGGVEAAVIIAQHFIPSQFMVLGIFFISALISLSIRTSCGTIAAIVPIAVSISQSLEINFNYIQKNAFCSYYRIFYKEFSRNSACNIGLCRK